MMTKKQQAATLGLLLASVAIFGVTALTNQATDTSNQAAASTVDSTQGNVIEQVPTPEDNFAAKEQQKEIQEQKKADEQKRAQEQAEAQKAEEERQQESTNQVQENQVVTEEVPAQPVAETPAQTIPIATEAAPTTQEVTATQAHQTPSMTLTIAGNVIPYQNGGANGQAIIDANGNGTASTFGGASVQSGSDNMNTHFIGHNPGIFSALFSLNIGNQVIVTDANGTPTTYTVTTILEVDDYGYGVSDKVDYYDTILGTGGGERITLQTCITDTTNLIVIAQA